MPEIDPPLSLDLTAASPSIGVPYTPPIDTAAIYFSVTSPEVHTENDGIAKMTFQVATPTMLRSDYEAASTQMTFSVATPSTSTDYYTLPAVPMTLRVVTPSISTVQKTNQQIEYTPALEGHVLDIPPLRDEHAVTAGLYFAATAFRSGRFKGAVVYESRDGTTFEPIEQLNQESVVGRLTADFGPTRFGVWDRVSTFDIELDGDHELASTTETKVAEGANWALLGAEIIGFSTATLISSHTYRLSGLIRGMRDTSTAMTHLADERFVLLTDENGTMRVKFCQLEGQLAVGKSRSYKLVSAGATTASADTISKTLALKNVSPFTPGNVRIDAYDGITADAKVFRWRRRTRARVSAIKAGPVPMMDETESYELQIQDNRRGDSLLRRNNRNISDTNEMLTLTYNPATSPAGVPADQPQALKQVGAIANSDTNTNNAKV